MFKQLLLVTFSIIGVQQCTSDTSLSGCKDLDPVPHLNLDKLMGIWYVVQKTSSPDSCLAYNFTKDDAYPGKYQIVKIEQHDPFSLTSLHYEERTEIKMTIPDSEEPGKINLKFPYSLGTTKMTVFMTDYENYLGVYYCKQTPLVALAHSWSAEILSRERSPDMDNVDKVRTRLSSYNIDPFRLSMVMQNNCPEFGTQGSLLQATSNIYNNVKKEVSNVVSDVIKSPTTESP